MLTNISISDSHIRNTFQVSSFALTTLNTALRTAYTSEGGQNTGPNSI